MNPEGKVRGLPRQAKMALAGLLGVGVLGVTAYLLLGQPQSEEAAHTELLSVSSTPAKAPASSSAPASTPSKAPVATPTPTVRTQKPLTIPELPFLVNTPGSKVTGSSSSKPGDGSTTATNADTGLKNPFQPFRVKPKAPTTPVAPTVPPTPMTPQVQPSTPTEPVVIRPPSSVPTNNPSGSILVPNSSPIPQIPVQPTPITPITPTKPSTPTKPTKPPRQTGSTPAIVVPGTTKLPNPPSGTATPLVIAVKPVIKTPLPSARAWRSSTPVTLPASLSQGTLPAIPPIMSQTVGAPRPEDAPPVAAGNASGSSAVPDTLQGLDTDVALLTPGQKLIPDPPPAPPLPPEPSALELLVKDQSLSFSSVVLGPVNTAIFNTKNGFIVVPLGQTLPDSEVMVQTVTANSATLQLGKETLELTLDRR